MEDYLDDLLAAHNDWRLAEDDGLSEEADNCEPDDYSEL